MKWFGGARKAGECDGGVWLGDGRAMFMEERMGVGRGEEVVMLCQFEGARNIPGERAKMGRADKALRGRTLIRGRVCEKDARGQQGCMQAKKGGGR